MSIIIESPYIVIPGNSGTFTVTVTNLGPSDYHYTQTINTSYSTATVTSVQPTAGTTCINSGGHSSCSASALRRSEQVIIVFAFNTLPSDRYAE